MSTSIARLAPALLLASCSAGPGTMIREGAGAVSQTLCSKVFISGLDPEDVLRTHLKPEPGMGFINAGLHYTIDPDKKTVRTTVFGGFRRDAVYAEGRGCTLVYPDVAPPAALAPVDHAPAVLADIAGPEAPTTQNVAIGAALDRAFAEPAKGAPRNTQAVVVVHGGRIIAERYVDGIGPETPLLAHSVTKSVVSALIGVLVRDGRLKVTDTVDLDGSANGKATSEPVTIDQLLRMTAGFGFDEGSGASIATHIWYNEPDTAGAASRAKRVSAPGEAWGYCSRCYVLLGKVIGDAVGGGPQGVRDFAQRELFDPLGMRSAVLEFDAEGHLMGAQASFASPRDWAKFGLLYLNDGQLGTKRILPEGWVAYSTRPNPGTGYGAGFWLNTTTTEIDQWRMAWGMPGAPKDAYFARGYMGQYVVVVPSADLVVVRFGQSHARGGDIASVGELVSEVIAALAHPDGEG